MRLPLEVVFTPAGRPKAVILAVHGLNDRKAAFARFGRFARRHGILVVAYDQPGFGARPDRGRWPGEEALLAELDRRLVRLARRFPDVPRFLLGHSMGAAVVIRAAARGLPVPVDGVVLAAPAVWGGETLNPLYRLVLWLAARIAPDVEVSGRGLGRRASDDDGVLRELARDPLFLKTTRIATLEGVVRLMDRARADAARLRLPVLVLVGARDEIVPPSAQISFAAKITSPHCTLVVYPQGWHLLLRDRQRERVWRDVLAWLSGRPLPSALGRACSSAAQGPSARCDACARRRGHNLSDRTGP